MRTTFLRETSEPSYLSWSRTLTLSGEHGRLEVALTLVSPRKGEKIALSHELTREAVVRLTEADGVARVAG